MTGATKSALLCVVLTLALALPVAAADRALAVGDRAPDLELSDQHGRSVMLSEVLTTRDYVVLAFYLRAFSGG